METSPSSFFHQSQTVENLCPHIGRCGGCSHQKDPYPLQLSRKEASVRAALQDIPVEKFESILPSPETFYHRNKMEFSFGDAKDIEIMRLQDDPAFSSLSGIHVGLHPKGRFAITLPTPDCRLLSKESSQIMKIVQEWGTEFSQPVYVRVKNQGVLRHLVIREGKNTNERLVMLVASSAVTHLDVLSERLKSSGLNITTFLYAKHDGLSDIARGSEVHVQWGNGWIEERVGRITFRVSPYSFMQTNTHAAEGMIDVLRGWIKPSEGILLDLYCGAGTLGLNMADLFKNVIGMECEPESVANARETAERNGLKNVFFESGRVEKMLDKFPHDHSQTICMVDPPRAGLHVDVVKALVASKFSAVIYVSCNPVSLARDLKGLQEAYTVLQIKPMDFFPHTDHIETAVYLSLTL